MQNHAPKLYPLHSPERAQSTQQTEHQDAGLGGREVPNVGRWRVACLRRRFQAAMAALLVLAGGGALAAEPALQQQRLGDDVYTSAGTVTTASEVAGDAFVAGGRVRMSGAVGGDALVAGGSVSIGSRIDQDLYVAGGEVRLMDAVAGNARAVAGRFILEKNAMVEGGLTLFGGNVTLDGNVGGYALISAGRTEVNGQVAGDLRVFGGSLVLGPEAVILGELDYRGGRPAEIAPGARISGRIEQARRDRQADEVATHPAAESAATGGVAIVALVVWLIGLLIVTAVLLACAPRVSRIVSRVMRGRPWAAPLLGLALFVCLPLVAVLLMVTVVGLPIGVLVLSAWLMLSLFGYFVTAIALGDAWVERTWPASKLKRIGGAALAILVLFALGLVPYVGWLVWAVAVLAGIGGIVLTIYGKLTPSGSSSAR